LEGLIEDGYDGYSARVGDISLPGRITDPDWHPQPGTKVKISIRPEALGISPKGEISGKIVEKVYLGQCIQYWLDASFARLQMIELNPQTIHAVGDLVRLSVAKEDVIILES
jgi:ABC-type Fe3+/spermidine/putrescine transport system ATPase subunit